MEKYTEKVDFRATPAQRAIIEAIKQHLESLGVDANDSDAVRFALNKTSDLLGRNDEQTKQQE